MPSNSQFRSVHRVLVSAVLVGVWHCSAGAIVARATTNGTWSVLSGSGPSARKGHTAIYDAPRQRILVFGGEGTTMHGTSPVDTLYNDVWSLNLCDTPTWTKLTPSGTPPSGREDHSAVYDPVNQRMIVFGGEVGEGASNLLSDTWALNLSGTFAWQPLSPTGESVCARSGQSATWNSYSSLMVMYGGNVAIGSSTIGSYDTYEFSSASTPAVTGYHCNEGSDCVPINGHICTGLPSPREYQSTTFDPLNHRTVLYAGWYEDRAAFDDVWEWHAGAWTQLSPTGTSPGGRENHRVDYDTARNRLIVFGGDNAGLDEFSYFNTVHELSLPSGGTPAWTQLSPSGTAPSARSFSSLVYDPVHDRCIVFGGVGDSDTPMGDTWLLTFSNPTDATAPATTSDLHISNTSGTNVQLSWTAPGDDGTGPCPATSYEVRKLVGTAITDANWASATTISGAPTPGTPGTTQSMWTGNVGSNQFVHFAMRTSDEVPNTSATSNDDCVKFTSTTVLFCSGGGDGLTSGDPDSREGAPAFAIRRLGPNPTRSGTHLSIAVPGEGTGTVEVLDVAGRIVLTRELGMLSAGVHELDLAGGTALHAGYYLVRVRFGAERRVSPLVVLD